MTHDEINELLSAYLDGESENPDVVERLLETEPEVRRRFERLKAQSDALRALAAPDVPPAFASRILAGVREERLKRHRGWMPLVLPLAAVAAVVVVLGAVYFATQTPLQPDGSPAAFDIATLRQMDPEMLDALLVEQLAGHPRAMEELEAGYDGVVDDSGEVTALFTLDEIADVINEDVEIDVLIEELNADEKAVFRELLIEYAMEG